MTVILKVVPTDGAALATESFGAPIRGVILLAMGATASMVWWPLPLCHALADAGYQVVRFDHRDTGASTTGAPGDVAYDVSDLANDLGAILDAYDAPAAHLVGMSLGGYAAQLFALQHPQRVRSLTLIAAEPLGVSYAGAGMSEALMQHFGTMADLDWSDRETVAAFMLTIAELSAGPAPGFDRADAEARIAVELSRTTSIQSAFNHAMLAGEVPPGLTAADLSVPALVIHGTADPVISITGAEASAQAIPGARLVRLEGRGHELAPADLPRIAQEIVSFIGG